MKQKNDKTNRKTTALAGAVAITNIGASHLFFLRRVRSRRAAAGYRRRAAPVEAFEAVSAMGSKNLRLRPVAGEPRPAGRPAGTHLAPRGACSDDPIRQLRRQRATSPARLGLSL